MIKQIQLLSGILFLGILIYSGLWYTAAFQAEKDVVALLSSWRDRGVSVEHGSIKHGGFPYRITVGIKDLQIATRAKGLDINAQTITLISHLWTPQHWLAEVNGLQLHAADNSTRLTSDFLLASYKVHTDGKTLVAFDSTASRGVSLNRLAGTETTTPDTWQFFLRFGGDDDQTQSGLYGERKLGFKLAAAGNTYSLDIVGGISGPTIKDWTSDQLTNWSNEGGLLELDKINASAGGGALKGNGSLTLDEAFYPLGSVSLTFDGGTKVQERLKEAGIKLDNNLPDQGLVSFMLQNGALTANGAPLLKLKQLKD
ncbi:MAG: DUF2125 domain-containing protein [Kordiimonas sp.]